MNRSFPCVFPNFQSANKEVFDSVESAKQTQLSSQQPSASSSSSSQPQSAPSQPQSASSQPPSISSQPSNIPSTKESQLSTESQLGSTAPRIASASAKVILPSFFPVYFFYPLKFSPNCIIQIEFSDAVRMGSEIFFCLIEAREGWKRAEFMRNFEHHAKAQPGIRDRSGRSFGEGGRGRGVQA